MKQSCENLLARQKSGLVGSLLSAVIFIGGLDLMRLGVHSRDSIDEPGPLSPAMERDADEAWAILSRRFHRY